MGAQEQRTARFLSKFCFFSVQQDGPHEGDEGRRQGNEQGSVFEGNCGGAWLEAERLLQGVQQPCGHCLEGSEEDWHFHSSRFVPHQDPNKASNQGGSESHVWQGGQSQGKASQDGCEGFPSGCIEESDLDEKDSVVVYAFSDVLPWESHGAGLRQALLGSLLPLYICRHRGRP